MRKHQRARTLPETCTPLPKRYPCPALVAVRRVSRRFDHIFSRMRRQCEALVRCERNEIQPEQPRESARDVLRRAFGEAAEDDLVEGIWICGCDFVHGANRDFRRRPGRKSVDAGRYRGKRDRPQRC